MTKYINDIDDRLLNDDDIYEDDTFNLDEHFDTHLLDDLEDESIQNDEALDSILNAKSNKKVGHYLSNTELEIEHNKSIMNGEPTPKLIEYFTLIATNVSVLLKIKSKLDVDCCITYGISRAWEKWDKYDPNNTGNYFSFFTTMIFNDMKTHRDKHLDYENINKRIYFNDIFME